MKAGERGKGFFAALDERYQLAALMEFLKHKEVPTTGHSVTWYYFGGVALFFFAVQIATGILLLMYYQVGGDTAYESMKHLVGHVPFGWLMRSIHCWSAHLMCLAALIHMASVFFTRSYRKPRELTWWTGCGLLGMALAFGFSGYLLPWNELSYFATAVGTDSLKSVPLVGPWLLRVLRGGEEVSVNTLYRFFALHVAVLPLVTAGLIGFHVLLVQRQGMAPPLHEAPAGSRPRALPFFPNFALRDLLLWVVCLNALAILAVLLPYGPGIPGLEWELGLKADPLKPAYPGIKPEWYFLWIYQLLREFPPHLLGLEGPQVCLLLVNAVVLAVLLVPVLDRGAARGRPGPVAIDLGVALLLFVSFLTLEAWDIGVPHVRGEDPTADPVKAQAVARAAASLTLLLALLITAFRRLRFRHTSFLMTGAACLLALLHGFAGVAWPAAFAASVVAGLVGAVVLRQRAVAAVAPLLLAVAVGGSAGAAPPDPAVALAPATARAAEEHVPEARWPKDFTAIFQAKEIEEPARARFRALPSHAQKLFFTAAAGGYLSSSSQLATLLGLDLDDRTVELLLSDNCVLCHTNPDIAPDESLFRPRPDRTAPLGHLDLREVVADVHFRKGLMCSGCHGGQPTDAEMTEEIANRWPEREARKKDRSWIPAFCARCHASSELMRGYNPKLPVDQLTKYETSRHGERLLKQKDSRAAQCVSCHGVHGIRGPSSPLSMVNAANVPKMCGTCHADPERMKDYKTASGEPLPTNQLELYLKSVHGQALLVKRDLGAPACNDCHGNHAALPPETAHVSQVCRNCHGANAQLFDGSPHKKAFEEHRWPECATCHGTHAIARPGDDLLGTGPRSTCTACHAKFGRPECDETAEHFRTTIAELDARGRSFEPEVVALSERGFDLDELRFLTDSAAEALRTTRQAIHTFDRSDFGRAAGDARKELASLEAGVKKRWDEYQYRRRGLLFSTALITIFGLALFAKIRQVDRKRGLRP